MALLNIVINALDAMPRGGALTIAASPAKGSRMQIQDTGTGSPRCAPRIFEPWVDKAVGRGTERLGLHHQGRNLAHGDAITVATTPRSGTTFTIVLPALEQPPCRRVTGAS